MRRTRRSKQIDRDTVEALLPVAVALARAKRKQAPDTAYWNDPSGWLRERIPSAIPTPYQAELLDAVPTHKRVSGRGPHGLGKTTLGAWILLWFVDTRSRAGADWKVVTTAGSWSQLQHFFWPEVHKWVRAGRFGWLEGRELLQLTIKLRTGQAFGVASDRPELIEGAHADQLLYIYDEAKSIPAATFDATEGAFSGVNADEGREAFAWAGSTPGSMVGRFAEIHHRKAGLEDWYARHVTLEDSIAAGRISREWAEQRGRQWGLDSAVYKNRVLGEFATEDAQTVIPLSWLEEANERWRALEKDDAWAPFTGLSVDVARFGEDKTVIAARHGAAIKSLTAYAKASTTETTGHVQGMLRGKAGWVTVDVIGLGAGVVDQLREARADVRAFNASARSVLVERSGELGFVNRRSAAWWNLREILEPSFGSTIALPPDDLLTGDLTSPLWRVTPSGRIVVEGKDEIRKRLGRSTDMGDAVIQAFAPEDDEQYRGTLVFDDPIDISQF